MVSPKKSTGLEIRTGRYLVLSNRMVFGL